MPHANSLPCQTRGEAPVHAFVGLRASPLPSRQRASPLHASPSIASPFLPPLFPHHDSCLFLFLNLATGKHQSCKLALVLRSDAANDRGGDQTQGLRQADRIWRDGIAHCQTRSASAQRLASPGRCRMARALPCEVRGEAPVHAFVRRPLCLRRSLFIPT
jgi:hypothetical protein